MALLIAGVAFNTYVLTVANDDLLIRETEAAILADIGGFKSLYKRAGPEAVKESVIERSNMPANDFYYHLKARDGEFLAGNIMAWPTHEVAAIKNGILDLNVSVKVAGSDAQTLIQKPAIGMLVEFNNKDSLLVARSVQQIEFAVWLAQTSSWVMIIIVCIISVLSLAVAYYVVSRINLIADTADHIITKGNLSERLYVESEWDDLSKLTLVLNRLLDQVEHSIAGIRSVSNNIAHDLRTPLTRLKSHIEELPDSDKKHKLTDECDSILAIFNSLLRITFIETNAKRAEFDNIDLSVVIDDAIDLYAPMIENKQIQLTRTIVKDAQTFCDRSLMFQVFANVIDNAVKFTPEHETITIELLKERSSIVFKVTDSGIGVSEASLDKLTRRFFREDRSRTTQGNGLGLSLVSAVVALHRGTLQFTRAKQGTGLECTITIPRQHVD